MDEKRDNQKETGLNRRKLIGALGSPRSPQTNPTAFLGSSYGPFGGSKLGMYSFRNNAELIAGFPCGTWPVVGNSTYPIQFEFYNYGDSATSTGNSPRSATMPSIPGASST